MDGHGGLSINALAAGLADRLIADAPRLRLAVSRGPRGETVIDAGARAIGGIEAGLRIAEICMGGIGWVSVAPVAGAWPFRINVRSGNPVLACLASQYAGWSLMADGFFALGSGPGRALARKEPIFADLNYQDRCDRAVLVLESDTAPTPAVVDQVAADCGVAAENLIFIHAPTQSLAGGTQVVARVLEVALHKAHALHFALADIVDGLASAPLPPPHPDFIKAMGRTNDAIIYGGQVHLFVRGPAAAARDLAQRLPSLTSRDHGRPFAEVFRAYGGDFYKIDPLLFSPALAMVTALDSGETFRAGAIDDKLLDASFS